MGSGKKVILTANAPQPIGPYSQGIQMGNMVFLSGQIALDPATGQVVAPSDVEAQTRLVMENVKAVLQAADCGFENIVKTTIFLKSMADFPKVNPIYGAYFKENPPARSTVEVSRLPKDVLVEVEVTAIRG